MKNIMSEIILQGIKKDDLVNEISLAVMNKITNVIPENEKSIEPLKDRKEASSYLRISLRKLDELTLRGEIKYYKIDSSVRFRQIDLDAFVSKKEVKIGKAKK